MQEIVWRGTNGHNFTPGRGGHRPIAIVNHVMMQSIERTREAFADPRHQASTTFGIGPHGEIDQYVEIADMPWANGPVRRPNLAAVPWIAELCQRQGINPNLLTISIEWAGAHSGGLWAPVEWEGQTYSVWQPGDDGVWWEPSPEQYEAGLWLHRKLIAELGITPDRAHICRHSDFDSVTRSFCPGKNFPLQRMLNDLTLGTRNSELGTRHIAWDDRPHSDFPVIGVPTISPAVFAAWLVARRSPALDEAPAGEYYRAALERGVNPALALAMFQHESQCGTDGVAAQTKNWGNLRPRAGGGVGRAEGKTNTGWGPFRVYDRWLDGLRDWLDLWFMPLYQGKSIREAIAIYAPSSDGNNPNGYAAAVLSLIERWDRESGEFDIP